MILLGITGPIGHGKSTLAQFLHDIEPSSQTMETWRVVAEVAEPWKAKLAGKVMTSDLLNIHEWLESLPAIVQQTLQIKIDPKLLAFTLDDVEQHRADYQKLFDFLDAVRKDPNLLTQPITDANKPSFRAILQWVGGYFVTHVDKGIWYDEIVRRARKAEAAGCQLYIVGGVRFVSDAEILKQAGGTIVNIVRPDQQEQDLSDPTERERRLIQADTIVINNSSLDDLKRCAQQLYVDCQNNALKPEYKAKA